MIHICHANVHGTLYRNWCRALLKLKKKNGKGVCIPGKSAMSHSNNCWLLSVEFFGHSKLVTSMFSKHLLSIKSSGKSIWQSSALALKAWRRGAVTYWVSAGGWWGGTQSLALQQCHSTPGDTGCGAESGKSAVKWKLQPSPTWWACIPS